MRRVAWWVRRSGRIMVATSVLMLAACDAATEPAEQVIRLEVAPQRVPCDAFGVQECLQVRTRADESWQLFSTPIEGFSFEPGFEYVLLVARREIEHPPADGSSAAYRLLSLLRKVPA